MKKPIVMLCAAFLFIGITGTVFAAEGNDQYHEWQRPLEGDPDWVWDLNSTRSPYSIWGFGWRSGSNGYWENSFPGFGPIDFHYNPPNPVPEPSTMILLGAGLIGLAGIVRKKTNLKK